jgi:hypothetical protein
MTRGFSLLELIFALLLLQVGLLAGAGMIHLSQANVRRAELTLRAVLEAGWLGDSLVSLGAEAPGMVTLPWGTLTWSAQSSPIPSLRIAAWSEVEGDTLATILVLPPVESATSGPYSENGHSWPSGSKKP